MTAHADHAELLARLRNPGNGNILLGRQAAETIERLSASLSAAVDVQLRIQERAEANARLSAASPALFDALSDLDRLWGRTGDSMTDFEDVAEWFYQETGFLRPGKDCRINDPDVRRTHYDAWIKSKRDKARAALKSARREKTEG